MSQKSSTYKKGRTSRRETMRKRGMRDKGGSDYVTYTDLETACAAIRGA